MQYFYVCKGKQILKIQKANQITNKYFLKKNISYIIIVKIYYD